MKVFVSIALSLVVIATINAQSSYGPPSSRPVGGASSGGQSSYGPPSSRPAGGASSGGRGSGGSGSSYNGGGAGGSGSGSGGSGDDGSFGPAQYSFQYDVNDAESGNNFGHQESRDGDRTDGKYYVLLPDTRLMTVEYYVDETGYHPTITFEGEAQFPEDQQSSQQTSQQSGRYSQPSSGQFQQPSSQYQQPSAAQSAPSSSYGQPFGK